MTEVVNVSSEFVRKAIIASEKYKESTEEYINTLESDLKIIGAKQEFDKIKALREDDIPNFIAIVTAEHTTTETIPEVKFLGFTLQKACVEQRTDATREEIQDEAAIRLKNYLVELFPLHADYIDTYIFYYFNSSRVICCFSVGDNIVGILRHPSIDMLRNYQEHVKEINNDIKYLNALHSEYPTMLISDIEKFNKRIDKYYV